MPKEQRKAALIGLVALTCVAAALWLLLPASRSPTPAATPTQGGGPMAVSPSATIPTKPHGWIEDQALILPRRALAAATNDRYVYAIGGMDAQGNYVGITEFAAIGPDGALGPWQHTSSLSEPRFYLDAAIIGNYLYAIGGASGPRGAENMPVATVERAAIQADGSLGPWQRDAALTTPRRGLRVVTVGTRIYALGGYNGVFLKTSESTAPGSNGTLNPWQPEEAIAVVDRYIHAAAAHGQQVYLLAGHVQDAQTLGYGNVEVSRIQASGALGPWQIEAAPLRRPRFLATALAAHQHLFVIGGHDGARQLTSIEAAPILADGHLGPWRASAPLPAPRSAAAAVTAGGWIYVIGGAEGERPVAPVVRHLAVAGR